MISEEFKRNVEFGDLITVRSALLDYLIIDTTFAQFDEALKYAQNTMPLIDEENGKEKYNNDENAWNENYLNKQKVALMVNFSKKRIEHIKNVARFVLDKKKTNTVELKSIINRESNGSRTGKTIISSKEIVTDKNRAVQKPNNIRQKNNKNGKQSRNTHKTTTICNKRSDRHENELEVRRSEKEVNLVDIASWMIVGAIAVSAIGGITASIGSLIAKPAVVNTGLVTVGVGGFTAVSGGVIKIVKKV